MYKKDKFGEYKRAARWVDAWRGEGGAIVAGWCVSELREYADGTKRVHSEPAKYVGDEHPSASALHEIYMRASRALGA